MIFISFSRVLELNLFDQIWSKYLETLQWVEIFQHRWIRATRREELGESCFKCVEAPGSSLGLVMLLQWWKFFDTSVAAFKAKKMGSVPGGVEAKNKWILL